MFAWILFNVIFAISATSLMKWSLINNNNMYGIVAAFFLNTCSFSLYLMLLKSNSLATTQISISSTVIFMSLFSGYILFDEPITIQKVVGGLISICGLFVVNYDRFAHYGELLVSDELSLQSAPSSVY